MSFCSFEFVNLKQNIWRKWTYHHLISVYEPWGCWIPLSKYMRMNRQRNWIIILPKKKIIVSQKSQNTVKKRRLHLIYEFHIFIQIQTRWLQFKTDSSYAVSKRMPEIYVIMNVFRVYILNSYIHHFILFVFSGYINLLQTNWITSS